MGSGGTIFFWVPIAVGLLAGSYIERHPARPPTPSVVETLLQSLRATVDTVQPRALKYGVGVNGCLDLVAGAVDVLFKAGLRPQEEGGSKCGPTIESERDFLDCFEYHFKQGAAGERFVADRALFLRLVEAARALPKTASHLGGNAAIIAVKLVETGAASSVLLGAVAGPNTRDILPTQVTVPVGAHQDLDEVHMILEYARGQVWGRHTAPRANRFIITHDVANAQLKSLDAFSQALPGYAPDTVVFSGLHMLEGQPAANQQERLEAVQKFLLSLPPSTPVHLELAAFGDLALLQHVGTLILPHVTSLGLNEQELASLSAAMGTGPISDYVPVSVHDVGLMVDCLHWLVTTFGPGGVAGSRLGRVHFHSLGFHIMATVATAGWGQGAVAVAAGSLAASTAACDSSSPDGFDVLLPTEYRLSSADGPTVTLDPAWPVHAWTRGGVHYELAPVAVCKAPVRTVGLGDTISARGLQYHTFSPQEAP